MSTKKKSADKVKNSHNRRRKAEYSAMAERTGRESSGQKRARLKAKNAVRVVGSYVKHPVNPCGNHACRSCYLRFTA